MGLLDIFRRTTAPAPTQRSFEGATGSRRASPFRAFGSTATETLAAGPVLRSRARHAYANNALVRNAVDAIVAEVVGAGITATSAHPDAAMRPPVRRRAFLVAAHEMPCSLRNRSFFGP